MSRFEKKVFGRGAAYIYIETITSLISGYIFWLIMSKITTSDVIGTSSSVVSFAGVIGIIASLGISTGIQRFIGKSFAQKRFDDAKTLVITSLVLTGAGILISSVVIFTAQNWIKNSLGFDLNLLVISVLLIGSSNITLLFRSVVISSMKTGPLPLIYVSSSATRLVVAVILLILGTGAIGLTFGYTLNQVVSSVLLAVVIFTGILRSTTNKKTIDKFIINSKRILTASAVNWIPLLVITAGSQLGTIVVYGSHGANQAGFYFLALTIVTGIIGIMNSLFSIALPTISGLTDYRKRFAWHAIRLSAVILLPLACSLIFYADDVMRLFGDVYVGGSISLQILLLSILPTCIATGISTLNFAYGNYRYVLMVGLVISISQTLLYFILAPSFSGFGVAIGYTTGSVLGLLISIPIARKIGLMLFWKDLAMIFIIPTTIGYVLNYLNLNYVFGILLTIISSYILLLKFSIVTRSDIRDILQVLPENVSNTIIKLGSKFKKF